MRNFRVKTGYNKTKRKAEYSIIPEFKIRQHFYVMSADAKENNEEYPDSFDLFVNKLIAEGFIKGITTT